MANLNKYDVFISYSRKDYVDEHKNVIPDNEVSKIKDALTDAGITFWMDEKGIVPGEDYAAKILKYIKASKVFVYISSKNATESDWTRKEIACALMYKKYLIPVLLDDSPFHDAVMLRIVDLDRIDYYLNSQNGLEKLTRSIKIYLSEIKASEARQAEAEKRRREELERQCKQQEEEKALQEKISKFESEIATLESQMLDRKKIVLQKEQELKLAQVDLEDCDSKIKKLQLKLEELRNPDKERKMKEVEEQRKADDERKRCEDEARLNEKIFTVSGVSDLNEEKEIDIEQKKRILSAQDQKINENNMLYCPCSEVNNSENEEELLEQAFKYKNGNGVKKNSQKAFDLFYKVALKGNPIAQFELANCYLDGDGVENDEGQSEKWYKLAFEGLKKAGEQGDLNSIYYLGCCYSYDGYGVEGDSKKAFNYYKIAAERGHAKAQKCLSECYLWGDGVRKNSKKAMEWLLKASESGNPEVFNEMGYRYSCGRGVKENQKEAFKWYMKAAEKGYAESQWKVAFCYKYGMGIKKDFKKMFYWNTKAAQQDYQYAYIDLARCYEQGMGVSIDLKQAFYWYNRAAECDDVDAMFKLGECYLNGIGVIKSKEKASAAFQRVVKEIKSYLKNHENDGDSFYKLGVCYYHGYGVRKNKKKAFDYFTKADEAGNLDAFDALNDYFDFEEPDT